MKMSLLALTCVTICCSTAISQVKFPLRVSDNKRHLVDKAGRPFPILGRTAWFVISQPENGYKKFIENSISHGHNSIELAAITHWPTGNHAPSNGEGELPFLKTLNGSVWTGKLKYETPLTEAPDLTKPNEKYWQYLDRFLKYCESKGLLVFMFPAYLGYEGKEQGWMQELVANGKEKSMSYGAWIANRYRDQKNIVWMLLGDMGKLNEQQRVVEQALIDGLKSVKDQQSILYTAESHSGENAADNIHFGKEMTINGVYTWELKVPVPFLARKAYQHEPLMPAFLLEEPYDEEGPDGNKFNPNATQPVRRFQYWGWLSTIGGYVSGNGYVWPFIDPLWQQHLDSKGALDMMRMNKLIRSLEWWKLVPSGLDGMKELILNPGNNDRLENFISAAAAKDSSFLLAYIPPAHKGAITLDLSVLNKTAYAYWFDPTNGTYNKLENSPFKNAVTDPLLPPARNYNGETDWVLLVTTTSLNTK